MKFNFEQVSLSILIDSLSILHFHHSKPRFYFQVVSPSNGLSMCLYRQHLLFLVQWVSPLHLLFLLSISWDLWLHWWDWCLTPGSAWGLYCWLGQQPVPQLMDLTGDSERICGTSEEFWSSWREQLEPELVGPDRSGKNEGHPNKVWYVW